MTDSGDAQPYEQTARPRKSRRIWWIGGIGLLLIVLLGTCVRGGIDLFKAVSARNAATEELAHRFLTEGLPPADDPIYARRAGVSQDSLDALSRFVRQFGKVSDFSPATCNIVSSANSNPALSGTFGNCSLTAQAEHSPVIISVTWVQEDEIWKLLNFHANFTDNSVLIEKAERLDQIATEEQAEKENPE